MRPTITESWNGTHSGLVKINQPKTIKANNVNISGFMFLVNTIV